MFASISFQVRGWRHSLEADKVFKKIRPDSSISHTLKNMKKKKLDCFLYLDQSNQTLPKMT